MYHTSKLAKIRKAAAGSLAVALMFSPLIAIAEDAPVDTPAETPAASSTDPSTSSASDTSSSASDTSDTSSSDTASTAAASDTSDASSDTSTQSAAVDTSGGEPSTTSSSSTSDESHESTDTSSSSSASSSAATTTATGNDDLTIHATTTGGGPDAVLEIVDQLASTSESGFAPLVGGGTPDSPGAASTTDGGENAVIIAQSTTTPDLTSGAELASTTLASTSASTTIIQTGNATALANVLNMLNTTFLNSNGSIIFGNLTDTAGTLDFRDPTIFSGLCGGLPCMGHEGIALNLDQDGHIDNDILLDAVSGHNDIANVDAAAILTGSALAGLNLVNIANVTFANSNYLLITLNAFQGVKGDIIFPSLAHFFENLIAQGASSQMTQNAVVDNDAAASADSGSNTVQGGTTTNSTIMTGDANSFMNVYNQINSQLANSGVSIMFRVSGKWTGSVFGAPTDVNVVWNPDGSIYLLGAATDTPHTIMDTGIVGTTSADISNNVRLNALSGSNGITDASSTALISTGDAFAAGNIINIANQTIMGRNWILAVINIFGDFDGNISFGQPDIWVGDAVQAPARPENGSEIVYEITVKNQGDADASHVVVRELADLAHLDVSAMSSAFTEEGGAMLFDLGSIPAGSSKTISYHGVIKNAPDGTVIQNHTSATLHEPDGNTANNSDSATLRIGGGGGVPIFFPIPTFGPSASSPAAVSAPVPAILTVERETAAASASREAPQAREVLSVFNDGTTVAKNVVLDDVLTDPEGNSGHIENWPIGDLAPGEGVELEYTVTFGAQSIAGIYHVEAHVSADNTPVSVSAPGTIMLTTPAIPPQVATSTATTSVTTSAHTTHPTAPRQPRIPNAGGVSVNPFSISSITVPGADALLASAASAIPGSTSPFQSATSTIIGFFGLAIAGIYGLVRMFMRA